MNEQTANKLRVLPAKPGVYVFVGAQGGVLYVGKARSLRSRVRSYFQASPSDSRDFIGWLDRELHDIQTYVVGTEKEAALLENQLIKELQPRYNVKLRDDKDFLSLRLDPKAEWPRLEVVRRPKPGSAQHFGPYDSATSARRTLRLVNRHFQLRTCTDTDMKSRRRPCLQHQIGRCPAPCVYPVDRREYGEQVRNVALFLQGRHDELIECLEKKMNAASLALRYEQAAHVRDQLRAVEHVRQEQRVTTITDVDQDAIGYFRAADQAELAVLVIREGKLIGVQTRQLEGVAVPDDEMLGAFVRDYYRAPNVLPDEVLLPLPIEAMAGLQGALAEEHGRSTRLLVPRRGSRTKLIALAMDNAAHAYREKSRERDDVENRLTQLQERLRLPVLPRRIECLDVSHSAGRDTVASIVGLHNGAIDRSAMRSFRVRKATLGDDYGAMYEVLSRRFRRGRDGSPGWELPDLLVVDGGRGQLQVALAALRDLGVRELPVAAIAKERETATGETMTDRVYLPGQKNPVAVRDAAALRLLSLLRDEAHRASNALREKSGKRRVLRTELDDVKGVGTKTRTKLLRAFGSMQALAQADEDALVKAGATTTQARAIRATVRVTPSGPEATSRTDASAEHLEQQAVDNAFGELGELP